MEIKDAQKSLYAAIKESDWDTAKNLISEHNLDINANNGEVWNHIKGDTDYTILIGELGCSVNTKGAQSSFAMSSRDEDRILYFIDHGADINAARPYKTPKQSFFTHFVIQGISTELVAKLIEKGADPKIDKQDALRDCLENAKFPYIKLLLDNGCRLDAGEGFFFYRTVFNLLAKVDKPGGSFDQMMRVLNYMLDHGANPALDGDDGWLMQRLQKNKMGYSKAEEVYDYLQDKIDDQLKGDHLIDPLFFKDKTLPDLRAEFNINGVKASGFLHAAKAGRFNEALNCAAPDQDIRIETADVLSADDRGLRVIDYVSVKGQLMATFSPHVWDKREEQAIDLEKALRPRYRSNDLVTPLKIARMDRRLPKQPPLKRRS